MCLVFASFILGHDRALKLRHLEAHLDRQGFFVSVRRKTFCCSEYVLQIRIILNNCTTY